MTKILYRTGLSGFIIALSVEIKRFHVVLIQGIIRLSPKKEICRDNMCMHCLNKFLFLLFCHMGAQQFHFLD